MTLALAPALAALLALAAGGAAAAPVCGETHVVRRGDTLQKLADAVYGREASFAPIWEANRARNRWRDPSRIEIGQPVYIPCLPAVAGPGGPPRAAAVGAMAAGRDRTGAATTEAADAPRTLRVGAAAAPPFLDPGAPDGGPGAALVVAALAAAGLPARVSVGGAEAAAPAAAPAGAWDLSLPWVRPDCAATDLAAADAAACERLVWSAPLWEIVAVHLMRAPEAAAATADSLRGRPVCVSPALPREASGPPDRAGPGGAVTIGLSARACAAMVAEGRADAAAMTADEADRILADAGAAAGLAEAYALTRATPVHAVAPAAAPAARADIGALDAGLAALRARGPWFAAAADAPAR